MCKLATNIFSQALTLFKAYLQKSLEALIYRQRHCVHLHICICVYVYAHICMRVHVVFIYVYAYLHIISGNKKQEMGYYLRFYFSCLGNMLLETKNCTSPIVEVAS